jgi:hypothetical protein
MSSNIPFDIRALSKLVFSGGVQDMYGCWQVGDTVTLESSMTEAIFSNKKLGVAGAMTFVDAFAPGLADNGAMTVLNLASNNLGKLVYSSSSRGKGKGKGKGFGKGK